MLYVYIDESGDLGFDKPGASRWFVFTLLFTDKPRKLEKAVKKVHRGLKKKYRRVSEMHAYHSDEITRKRVLRNVASIDGIRVIAVVLNKEKVYLDLKAQKNILYNYVANILLDRLYNHPHTPTDDKVIVCFDQKDTNRRIRVNFSQYLKTVYCDHGKHDIEIRIESSQKNKGLQAVDYVSWAIFRKHEHQDHIYYQIIESIILDENLLFP